MFACSFVCFNQRKFCSYNKSGDLLLDLSRFMHSSQRGIKVHRCLRQAYCVPVTGPNLFSCITFLFLTIRDSWDAVVNLFVWHQTKRTRAITPKEVLWVRWWFSTKEGRKKKDRIQLQCLLNRLNKWLWKCGSWTSSTSITWGNFWKCKFLGLTPDPLDQKLLGWGSTVCPFHKPSKWS